MASKTDQGAHFLPPPLPPAKKLKLFIKPEEDLYGGWGQFEVKDLQGFKALGFSDEAMEIMGQKDSGSYVVIVEELPHITLMIIHSATDQGVIVQSQIELFK